MTEQLGRANGGFYGGASENFLEGDQHAPCLRGKREPGMFRLDSHTASKQAKGGK